MDSDKRQNGKVVAILVEAAVPKKGKKRKHGAAKAPSGEPKATLFNVTRLPGWHDLGASAWAPLGGLAREPKVP